MEPRFNTTTVEPLAERPGDAGGRAGRAAATGAGETPSVPAPRPVARILRLDQGLFAVSLDSIDGPTSTLHGMTLPVVQISSLPSGELDPVEILAASGETGNWLEAEGEVVVVRAPLGGGYVLITTYEPPEQTSPPVKIGLRRLDAPEQVARPAVHEPAFRETPAQRPSQPEMPAPGASRPEMAGAGIEGREIRTEIAAHIERIGDRRFPGEGWIGNRGERLRIEAFSVRPLDELRPGDVEYMAFGPNRRETPWVSEGTLCGSRGRGLPLTGFAVRLAPAVSNRFDVIYQGSFFSGGVVGPCRNGEPCNSTVLDDPLEALHIRIVERRTGG